MCVDARHWHWVMSWSGFFEVQFGKCGDTQNCTKNEGTLLQCGTVATEGSTIHQFTVVGLLLSLYLCVTRWVSCGRCSTFWPQACLELPPSGRSKLQWPDGDWSVHGEYAWCSRCVCVCYLGLGCIHVLICQTFLRYSTYPHSYVFTYIVWLCVFVQLLLRNVEELKLSHNKIKTVENLSVSLFKLLA